MTPKEKAQELFFKYRSELDFALDYDICIIYAKKCSLIAVDEIIKVACDVSDYDKSVTKTYWKEVKQEIEKL
jgi:hypothetical protein